VKPAETNKISSNLNLRNPDMNATNRALTCVAIVATHVLACQFTQAQITWNSTTGDWETAANWSSNPNLPGANDPVRIWQSGTVSLNTEQTIGSIDLRFTHLTIQSGAALTLQDTATDWNFQMSRQPNTSVSVFGTLNAHQAFLARHSSATAPGQFVHINGGSFLTTDQTRLTGDAAAILTINISNGGLLQTGFFSEGPGTWQLNLAEGKLMQLGLGGDANAGVTQFNDWLTSGKVTVAEGFAAGVYKETIGTTEWAVLAAAVPEPSALSLGLLGALGLFSFRRSRRARA
jgi:hypothetical protein